MERRAVPARLVRDPRLVGSKKESPYKMKCQKCNDNTHWTYDCKKSWQYAHRDSRTAELKKRVVEGPDGKIQVIPKPEPEKAAPENSSSGSDDSSSSDSSSDSDSSSSSSSSEDKKSKKRKKKSSKKVSKKKKK